MTRVALGLGGNLGDPRALLGEAVVQLSDDPRLEVLGVSGLWRTAAVGGPEQPDYLNAVVVAETGLQPEQLLQRARELEGAAGRQRAERWGPRTLDVDVLDVEGVRRQGADLVIPHPRAHERAFVLSPWSEVDPDWVLRPAGLPGRTVVEWLAAVVGQSVQRVGTGDWWR